MCQVWFWAWALPLNFVAVDGGVNGLDSKTRQGDGEGNEMSAFDGDFGVEVIFEFGMGIGVPCFREGHGEEVRTGNVCGNVIVEIAE